MSLLDDVSIVVTPNGYKAGTLFAVKPTIAYGSELVVNGDFSEGDTGWTIEAVWTISGGAAHGNGASGSSQELKQAVLEVGKTYEFSYEIRNRVSGSVELMNSGLGSTFSNQVYTGIGVAASTELRFRPSSFNGDIYNVSVREFTGADMDVTRATAATRVDENGLVNYAEIVSTDNVILNPNMDNSIPLGTAGSGWEQSNGIVEFSNGGLKLTNISTSARARAKTSINNSLVLQPNTMYQFTYDVISNNNVASSGTILFVSGAITGVIPNTVGSHIFNFISGSSTNGIFQIYNNTTNSDITFDNTFVKEVIRDNVPRIDYTGGGCPHILAEPQRTNLIPYSEDFTSWTQIVNITPTPNSTTSPSGENDGTKFLSTSSSSKIVTMFSAVSGTTYTFSVYCKNIDATFIKLLCYDGANSFNVNATSEVNTSTWTRISLTFTAANTGSGQVQIARDLPNGESVYFWGAQLEVGSYPTSLIPTSGSTVTRNQDIFTRDGIGSLINSTEGVLFVEMAALVEVDANRRFLTLNDGGASNNVVLRYEATGVITARYQVGGVAQCSIAFATTITNSHKIAFKYKENDFALWVDGTEIGTDTSGSVLAADTLNKISFDHGGGSFPLFGKVKQLQVYDTALTDEQLLQLTGESGTDFYESYAEMASALTYTIQ